MNRKLHIAIGAIVTTALVCAATLLFQASKHRSSQMCCERLEVEFMDSLKFLTTENIKAFVDKDYGHYVGKKLDSIDLATIEKSLAARSAISESEAWITPDGVLHVSIKQRAPQLRFLSGKDQGFYCDAEGYIFPLHSRYTAPVRLIEGDFPIKESSGFQGYARTEEQQLWIEQMLDLDQAIKESRSFSKMINDIRVASNGDIMMRVKGHEEIFNFGKAENFEEKFNRMEKYFTHILPAAEETKYKTVNVKYKNQIICK